MPIPDHLNTPSILKAVADAKAKGLCGERYRRTMYEAPWSRVCTKPAHPGGRHSDSGPKAEPVEPEGTCQICFRKQQTRKGGLVLHGYKRPGWGYTVGKCLGCDHAPFEVSCERTKEFLAKVLRPALASAEKRLAALEAQPDSLDYETRVYVGYENTPGVRGRGKAGYLDHTFQVLKGEKESLRLIEGMVNKSRTNSHGYGYTMDQTFVARYGRERTSADVVAQVSSYETCLGFAVRETKSRISHIKFDIEFFEKKVAAWAPVPWPAPKAA